MQLGGEGGRAGHAQAQAAQPARPATRDQPVVHGGHAEEEGGPVVPGGVRHGTGIESGQQHRRPAGQQGAVGADGQAVGVEERQAVHEPVVGRPPPGHLQRLRGGQQVAVAEDRALGRPGGPRRETDQGRVVGRGTVHEPRLGVGEVECRPGHDERRRDRTAHPGGLLAALHDGRGRSHVGDDLGELPLRVGRVGRDHHQPGPEGTHMGDQRVDRGARRPDDTVPGHEPGGLQPPRGTAGGRIELPGRAPAAGLLPEGRSGIDRPPVGPGLEQGTGPGRVGHPVGSGPA